MVSFLASLFIKNQNDVKNEAVRRAWGMLCSFVGIGLNIILFAGKLFAGMLSGSIAITADSFNNLSDAFSSIITLLGFKLAAKKPDPDHPFGHGRFEYISGLIVAISIIVMGFELARSSFAKIISPEKVEFSYLAGAILLVSIAVKLYMSFYNRAVSKKINSAAMAATAADSLSDTISTTAVLAAMILGHFTGLKIDGWAGMLVACFILWTGYKTVRETIAPLLGEAPDDEFVANIYKTVMAHKEISGVHDLVVHDYGPGRIMISLHAEVPHDMDIMLAHDVIDNIEVELDHKLKCHTTIHMDPVDMSDEKTNSLREKVAAFAAEVNDKITIHDFRVVSGISHTNLIFDAVIPYDVGISDREFICEIRRRVHQTDESLRCVIVIDRAYVK